MRNYYKKAALMAGPTGVNLLSLLERRLDNIVYKSGLGATIWAARQIVGHGHIMVNGQRVNLPSYQVRPGDVVEASEKRKKNVHIQEWVQQSAYFPPYLVVDKDNYRVTLDRVPEEGEVQTPIDIQQVVEFYNRLT